LTDTSLVVTEPAVRAGWGSVLAVVALCALAIAIAFQLDDPAYERIEYVRAHLGWATRERLGRLGDYAELLAKGWLTALIACAIYFFDPRGRRRAVVVVFSVLAVTLAANVIKVSTGRLRPKSVQTIGGVPVHAWLGPAGGLGNPRARSFPSGHTSTAFAHAAVLSAIYPAATPVFYALAAPVPISRVLMRAHFVSDVYAGGLLAVFLTFALQRSARFDQLCDRAAQWLPELPRHREGTPPVGRVPAT